MNLAYEAMMFAREVHKDQRRKYTNNPYTDHLAEVAGIAATVFDQHQHLRPDVAVAVCWLHDCMEDQGVTLETLEQKFGSTVAYAVSQLSDLEKGNRAARKAASRERLSRAWGWVQTIKCADLISNTSSIVMHDPKFAVVYLEEKRLLLDVLTKADPRLLALARAQATHGVMGMGGWSSERPNANGLWLWREGGKDHAVPTHGLKTCRAIEDCPHPQECGKAGGCERNDALRNAGVKEGS